LTCCKHYRKTKHPAAVQQVTVMQQVNNLDPQKFVLWQPPADYEIHVGPEQVGVRLPQVPLPIHIADMPQDGSVPSDHAIGTGVSDYLREFPECPHNVIYAELLRDGYAHYLADLGAQVVMLDSKDVEPAYIARKLTYLKIFRLLEPRNTGLLWQLCRGYYDLGLTFTELPRVRHHLLAAMRFGQDLLRIEAQHQGALNLMAEIDILFGDYPSAQQRLRTLRDLVGQGPAAAAVEGRLRNCIETGFPDHPLVDDLERIAEAMQLSASGNYQQATEILERLEIDDYFCSELKSADFLCLLGLCRLRSGDRAGAFDALSQALEADPEKNQAREALENF
jgi:hypothetical protein